MTEVTVLSEEPEWVPISALQHFSYCPRQCALIHLEQTFDENVYTLRGRHVHERVHTETWSTEGDVRVERGLPLWSERLGLVGKADVVEFHDGIPYPVEYKHGPRRAALHDDVQLCAQAMCLEEMLNCSVPKGAIFHYSSRRRREVIFTPELRARVVTITEAVRTLLKSGRLPSPPNDDRCRHCSLLDSCLPGPVGDTRRRERLLSELYEPSMREGS